MKLKMEMLLKILVILLIVLQPIIDMDYLLFEFLDQFGLPRFSTIIRFIIIPIMILMTFYLKEKNKKKIFALALGYGILFLGYFYLHSVNALRLYPILDFTTNFRFSYFSEFTYILTLIIPFGVMYCIYNVHINEIIIKKIVCFMSGIISIPILLGDLFLFGKSTYFGYTVANFISWFQGIYEVYHPRELTSKFFFNEGNTIGILMFMILPLLIYFFIKEENKTKKTLMGLLIMVQCLSMQILGTRVATYGAVIIPAGFIIIYLFDVFILKGSKLQISTLATLIVFTAIFGAVLNYAPAVENQRVDAVNDLALLENGVADEGREALKDAPLIPGSKEFNDFYIFMFEQYGIRGKYATSIPTMYYVDWYNYKFDPKFWVDVIFLPVFDRVSGRQIQTIFMNYKYNKTNFTDKILGMGYSTFMNGSIILEQDFKQQIYTLGYSGFTLFLMPWIGIIIYGIYKILKRFKKLFNLQIITYGFSLVAGLGCAYISGHTLDQFVTTMFMALLCAVLLDKVNANE